MAKKYLLLDNEVIAKQKGASALQRRYPNRDALQAQKHAENPTRYPATCITKYLHDWKKDELGRCEIEMDETDTQYYPDDVDDIRSAKAIEVAQGPK